ncbi:MAG TPA: DedA family protein [Streptosporangiaceae bacterium]|jgi:membrane-associated protein
MVTQFGAHVGALNVLSSTSLLTSLGALGIFLVLFAETGLLVGFFLPGDSLLFTAGLLCTATAGHRSHLSLPVVIVAAIGGALLGAQTGFYIGRSGGRRLLERRSSGRLHAGAERAEHLLARYGYGKAIVLARFIPVVRTVLNPVAGALNVPTRSFTIWQATGGVVWSAGITLAGYGLGSTIPGIDSYLLPAIAVVVLVSLIPIGIELIRARRAARRQHTGQSAHAGDTDHAGDATGPPATPPPAAPAQASAPGRSHGTRR